MFPDGRYVFKRAETPDEFEQIHCLNYRTFVTELAQYADPGTGRLVDKFHDKNTYFIALKAGRVVGMVSFHDRPPFSVADRLADPSVLNRPGTRPIEVRLLAVAPEQRHSPALAGLLTLFYEHAQANGYTHAYISGVVERLPLYQQFGFEPLGPAVRCGQASFVPMRVSISRLVGRYHQSVRRWHQRQRRMAGQSAVGSRQSAGWGLPAANCRLPTVLLPGPVTIASAVHAAFHEPPIYHRGPEFVALFERVRRALAQLTGARDVALFNGSGTLGNEIVAATLAAEGRPGGVLLVNGEFGERLARQAARFGLGPRVLRWPWGAPWDLDAVDAALSDGSAGSWVWGVHLESSTGVLNDVPGLLDVAGRRGVRVCLDCVSSLGAVPLDLADVYLATGATGKSLGSYAGIAIVLADARCLAGLDTGRVPSYLDLPAALATVGPRYTFPSPTLRALDAALAPYESPAQARACYERYADLGAYVRRHLTALGLEPLAVAEHACPVVTTFAPPGGESSEAFVARCHFWGYAIGGQSGYLAERRLVQIATMGAVTREQVEGLFEQLGQWLGRGELLAVADRPVQVVS